MGHKHIHEDALLRLDRFAIGELDLFKPMTGPEMEAILRQARILRIRQGQAVFRQGDTAHHFYLLLEGRLKVLQVTEDGHQIVVRIVNRGELFGIAKALRRPDYPGTATAAVDSTALAWSSSSWEDMTARYP